MASVAIAFAERCEACGIPEHIRDEFIGHSRGKLNNAYLDLSDEYLLKKTKNWCGNEGKLVPIYVSNGAVFSC